MRSRWLPTTRFHWTLYFLAALTACSSPDAPFEDAGIALVDEADPLAQGSDAGTNGTNPAPGDPAPPELTRSVRLRFRAAVGDAVFACGGVHVSSTGVSFTPADLRLFVQDPTLLTAAGHEQPIQLDVRAPWQLEDVALLDFEDASGGCLAGTRELNVEVTGQVPVGDYRGLAFTNGVPEADNHADPTRLAPPLQAGSMSWGWLLGFRFLMAEVAATGAGSDAGAPGSALLHLGSTACSGSPNAGGIACNKPNRNRVRLPDFDPDSDAVVVDIARLFVDTDLSQVTTCHSSGEQCAAFFERAGLSLDDGSATDRQTLYRVEPAPPAAP
jgi:uncharacterized repeat protein (TIGR04052 family)